MYEAVALPLLAKGCVLVDVEKLAERSPRSSLDMAGSGFDASRRSAPHA